MNIHIKTYQFTVSEPFQAGHPMTEGEAQALNALRAEHIRNNCFRAVARVVDGLPDGQGLTAEELAGLVEVVKGYDEGYVFVPKHKNGARLGGLETEARLVATDLAIATYGTAATDEQIDELAQSPEVLDKARVRLAARAEIAQESLEDLLNG